MTKIRSRAVILFLAMCLTTSAQVRNPTITKLSSPMVISGFADGAVIDLTNQRLVATQRMPWLLQIDGTHNPNGTGQTFDVTIKVGVVDANNLASNAIMLYGGIQDSQITIASALNAVDTGVFINDSPNFGFFNNFITIGAIRNSQHNGAVFVSPKSGVLGIQGNHIQIGQVIANGDSGILLQGVTAYNYLVVGPVEHNRLYGCYDEQGPNTWVIVNSNSNGQHQAC
jgi:hypothetical protein